MNKINQILKNRRSELGLTMLDVAKKVGVSEGTVSRWESGDIANMRRDKIVLLAQALSLSPAVIMGWEDGGGKASRGVKIPVLGVVRAGYPIYAEENIIDYEEISTKTAAAGEFFALRIVGDSMEPRMFEGDTVIVRKQNHIESGEIAVVLVNGDEATVKKVIKSDSGLLLVPLNSSCSYQPTLYTPKQLETLPVSIIGKVVEVRGKI